MVIHDILLHEYIIPRGRVIWYKHFRKTFILSSASEHTLSNFTSGRVQIFKERSAPCPKSHGPSGSSHCFGRYWKIWKHWKILEDLETLEDIARFRSTGRYSNSSHLIVYSFYGVFKKSLSIGAYNPGFKYKFSLP